MHNQPKFYPQRGTGFYADGRSVRPQVADTVGRGQLREDSYFYTGLTPTPAQTGNNPPNTSAQEGNTMPFPVTMAVLARGQEQYNIFCTPCHSRVGNGAGMIVQRGYAQAGNFHTARLLNAPLGHFFSVITNGYGAMPNYAAQLTPENRWAVVAYIKALQLSQNAQQADVPAGAHVDSLDEISKEEGFAPGFAENWALPPTAVTGTPDHQPYVIPPNQIGGGGNSNSPATRQVTSPELYPSDSIVTPRPYGQTSTGYPQPTTPESKPE